MNNALLASIPISDSSCIDSIAVSIMSFILLNESTNKSIPLLAISENNSGISFNVSTAKFLNVSIASSASFDKIFNVPIIATKPIQAACPSGDNLPNIVVNSSTLLEFIPK